MIAAFLGLPRWAHIALALGTLVLAALTLHKCAVSDAVKADRKATEVQVAKQVIGAERSANAADVTRRAEMQANDDQTRKAIENATSDKPEQVRQPSGPAVRAAVDSLRKRTASDSPATR